MRTKSAELSTPLKEVLVKAYQQGQSKSNLAQIFSIPWSTVHSIIKRFEERGTVENGHRSGRRKLFTARDESQLDQLVKRERRAPLRDITANFNENKDRTFSSKTIARKIKRLGYKRRVLKKKVVIRVENKKKRVSWSKARRYRTVEEFWKRWIFSDECKVVIGQNNHVYIWRKHDEVNSPFLTPPPSRKKCGVMIWGCITFDGTGTLTDVEGNINSAKYISILKTHLLPVIENHFPDGEYIFQDDNAPPHKSRETMDFIREKNITGTEWPAQSPDLNIIENIWLRMKRDIEKEVQLIETSAQLIKVIRRSWENINMKYIRDLYETIPSRLAEVIRMKGNMTKY